MGNRCLRLAPLLLAGCGLFTSEPELPDMEEVAQARRRDAEEWELLGQASRIARDGPSSLPVLRGLVDEHPESLRLRAFVQDQELTFAATAAERRAVVERYAERAQATPDAEAAYLAARIAPKDDALVWVKRALEMDAALVPAEVLRIGLEVSARDTESLDALVELLNDHPGSAEGWRLLAHFAPLYARPEFARRAALTEPWVADGQEHVARLAQAEAALDAEDPGAALDILSGMEDRQADLLRAAALTQGGRADLAETLLRRLVREDPADPVARFDFGLLALDYLQRPRLAREQLQAFLDLVAEGAEVPLQRKLQAEYWLEQLSQQGIGGRP